MKAYRIEENTPCLVVSNLKAQAGKFVPYMTTKKLVFDYPFWDSTQEHNRGNTYLDGLQTENDYCKSVIDVVSKSVQNNSTLAFIAKNAKGNTSLMLVEGKYVELLC